MSEFHVNYGRHGSVSGNVILNYFEQHVICVTEIRFEINSIHRVGQRSNIGVALALLGAENVDTTPNFAEGCSFLKGLYLTTTGSLRSRLGVGKVVFHRATELKF